MIRIFAAISILFAGPALAQPAAPASAVDREVVCFVAAAVSARRIEQSGESASAQDRQRAYLFSGVANYYGGRVSLRFTREQIPAQLAAGASAAERLPDLAGAAMECATQYLDFMQAVAGEPAAGAQ